jgi:aminoglycoside 3-N-acetyltransferase
MNMPEAWTHGDLVAAFRDVGIETGDSVIVHSSYRSLGEVEGGPEAVLDALLEAVGPSGNLVLPAFNYTRPIPEPYFDPAETPARTGIIAKLGRRRPEAVRSLSPTHSVSVIGPDAVDLTEGHLDVRTFGIGSPIDRLAKMGGKVLLLGVGNDANSTIHVAEEYAGVPKALWTEAPTVTRVLMPDGTVRPHEIDTSSSCSAAFCGADYALRRCGLVRDARLGGCKLQLMVGQDVIERVSALIGEQPDILLCTWSRCLPCTGARANLRAAGLPSPSASE